MKMSTSPSENASGREQGPLHRSWSFRFTDPEKRRALHLHFSLLLSRNGFRRVAEVCAVHFQRLPGRETQKLALKQTFDLSSFKALPDGGFQIGDCVFSQGRLTGSVQAKSQSIQWDVSFKPRQEASFDLIPLPLRRAGIIRNSVSSPQADLSFDGKTVVNGETFAWTDAPGARSCELGPESSGSSIWAHCNLFTTEQGVPVPFIFEGISLRGQLLGLVPTPRFSSLFFVYQGNAYHFHSLKDAVRLKSHCSLNEWRFRAERGDLLFRGVARIDHKDFAGLTYEDTNGSLLYVADSRLSDLEIQVYNRGKLESALKADQTASIEIISRKKNPYIPLLT